MMLLSKMGLPAAFFACFFSAISDSAAQPAPICLPPLDLETLLVTERGQSPMLIGVTETGQLVTLFATQDGSSFTIVERTLFAACTLVQGEHLRAIAPPESGQPSAVRR